MKNTEQPRYIVGGRQPLQSWMKTTGNPANHWQTPVIDTTTGEAVSWHNNWSAAAAAVRRLRAFDARQALDIGSLRDSRTFVR